MIAEHQLYPQEHSKGGNWFLYSGWQTTKKPASCLDALLATLLL
jgi:hypothetical protein